MNSRCLVGIAGLLALVGQIQGVLIGTLPNEQHGISGQFHIIDSKTIYIEDFNYDGGGPGAFLYYYRPGVAVNRNGGGFTIPLPSSVGQTSGTYPGAFQRRRFTNEDFTVTLPAGVDACDIGTITIWCQPFRAIFTRLAIPRSHFVNSGSDPCTVIGAVTEPPIIVPEFDNCKVLHDTLQVSWKVDNSSSSVRFQLCGCTALDSSTIQYLGFGLSGSTSLTLMFGADATIAWVDGNGMAQAQDYYLSNYVQCRGGSGACPDTVDTTTGGTCTNDVSDVSGFVQEGQQCISFTRPFNPTDSGTCDRPMDPTNQNQYIVWGIGSLGETAFQHHTRATVSDAPIHLGRAPLDECAGVELTCQECDPFPASRFVATEDTTFVAVIGPAANPRGYTALTSQPGWGIAWYINDTLIPELVVERGKTYKFLVYGGDNPADASNYHPFYITDSKSGGRLLNTAQQRANETVYAGFVDENPTAVGALHEYSENSTSETLRQSCGSYNDYFNSLTITRRQGKPGELVWRPDDKTPNVVYYQCASHLNLGWRISVTGSAPPPTTTVPPTVSTTPAQPETTVPPTVSTTPAQPETTVPPTQSTTPAQPLTTASPPQLLPAPVNVQAFCSHAVWRVPPGVPCDDILNYQIRLSNSKLNKTASRQAAADGTFYFLQLLDDDDYFHEDTQIEVRLVTSTAQGAPSQPISLGCPATSMEPPPSVYFELNGKIFTNNSVVNINGIGEGDEALLCKTDKPDCCGTRPNRFGEFYYPNGGRVSIRNRGEGFFRDRRDQRIRLNRRSGILSPTGVYHCEIPDSNDVMQKIFVNIADVQG